MIWQIWRYSPGSDTTLGLLFDITGGGQDFLCYTLEDEIREVKVPGETAIGTGTFPLALRTEGGMHPKYADRYGTMHKGMLWVRDVPEFEYIYLHTGVTDEHTKGCPLVADSVEQNISDEGSLAASRNAYRRIYPPMAAAIEAGEMCYLHVVNGWQQ
jgi:hypothetical protein|tara:strand:+ start:1509 stop:1979 length:471 start_codon:yes stop_codon:yes gene_type:complete